ncbi:MAG: O-antigen ligase family protein [Ruminococcaceae bacterium]|nr:O-antigen ligase family protein [Oscillospiraceae bacterium]
MSRVYVFFSYFIMSVMCFTFFVPVIDTVTILNYTLRIFIYYFFAFTVPFYSLGCISLREKGRIGTRTLLVIFFSLFSCTMSLSVSSGFWIKVQDALLFLMPVALCSVAEHSRCSRTKCIYILLIVNIIAGIVSFLAATGALDLNLWAEEGMLARTAGVINSTLGIGGFAAALILLFLDSEDKKAGRHRMLELFGLIGSILVVLFSLSRTRIVLLIVICFAILLYNLCVQKTIKGNVKMIAFIMVLLLLVIQLFPEIVSKLFDAIDGRYDLGNDINVRTRSAEQDMQLELFQENPIFGTGWGARGGVSVGRASMYIHNIYTTLLMQTGIVGTLLYLGWQFSYFRTIMRALKKPKFKKDAVVGLAFLLSLFVLGFTNSGLTQSGAFFMMFFIAALARDVEQEERAEANKESGG